MSDILAGLLAIAVDEADKQLGLGGTLNKVAEPHVMAAANGITKSLPRGARKAIANVGPDHIRLAGQLIDRIKRNNAVPVGQDSDKRGV